MELTERDSRTYRHNHCKGRTTVAGHDFVFVSNIMCHPDRTYCGHCGDYFAMHEFCWDDTGESLTDFYSRYLAMFEPSEKFWISSWFTFSLMGLGFFIGGILGYVLGGTWGWPILGICLGAVIGWFVTLWIFAVVNESICKRVLGTDSFTMLE